MTRTLMTFAAVFAILFGLFTTIGIQKNHSDAAIAKSPAYVLATPQGITKKSKKSRESFQVNFTYDVAGTTYKIDSSWLHTVAEAEALAAAPVQVVYATTAPGEAAFKSEFDKRDKNEGTVDVLGKAAGLAFLLAFVGTLLLIWKYPALRRA